MNKQLEKMHVYAFKKALKAYGSKWRIGDRFFSAVRGTHQVSQLVEGYDGGALEDTEAMAIVTLRCLFPEAELKPDGTLVRDHGFYLEHQTTEESYLVNNVTDDPESPYLILNLTTS